MTSSPSVAAPPDPSSSGPAVRLVDHSLRQRAAWLAKRAVLPWARARRRRLDGTLVVGVTGTAGKTTAVDLTAAVLASLGPGTASRHNSNRAKGLVRILRETGSRHRFTVHELAAWGPGTLDELLWTLEPEVGIVTSVGREHHKTFRSLEAVAAEKAKLVHSLPAGGLALLNADDPRVRAMADGSRARTLLFGCHPDADLRAEKVVAAWPAPLRFEAVRGDLRLPVETRLFGEHWLPSVLAAVALGLEAGVSPERVAAAVAAVEPQHGRMAEQRTASGVTFLDDAWKAPTWSLETVLEVLRTARCRRRLLVMGQLSDDPRGPRKLFQQLVPRALAVADHVVLVGRWSRYADLELESTAGTLHLCATVAEADRLLDGLLAAGDLVLLKGSRSIDHLERLVLSRGDGIACWRENCGRLRPCDDCSLRWHAERVR